MDKINAVITGVDGYVPDDVLTNADLSKMVDTTDEWIMTRVGIKERRILKDPQLGTAYMGVQAVGRLVRKKGIDPETIDGIICSTSTADYHFPSTASMIAYEAGCKNAFAFDIQAACAGLILFVRDVISGCSLSRVRKCRRSPTIRIGRRVPFSAMAAGLLF